MWTCLSCGADVDAGFEICWMCGCTREGVPDPSFHPEAEGVVSAEDYHEAVRERQTQAVITVGQFNTPSEAHVARNRLEADGIAAFVADELMSTTAWEFCAATGGAKVQVFEQDAARAREILQALAGDAEPAEPGRNWAEDWQRARQAPPDEGYFSEGS